MMVWQLILGMFILSMVLGFGGGYLVNYLEEKAGCKPNKNKEEK